MVKLCLVCRFAGAAAGVGTGFAGLSAATVIAPMLISFLGYPWYESVGIGLASDVLASAMTAVVYQKNKNVDLKHGIFMLVSVMVMTVVGSYFSQYMPDLQMGYFSVFTSLFMGIRFIVHPATEQHPAFQRRSDRMKALLSVLSGAFIGFYCGFMGVGGGLMMLFILTCILGYELKTAVGTSVFIMTFTALTGAVSHFTFGEVTNYIPALILCSLFTLIGAVVSSQFANKMDGVTSNRATGIVLLILGVCMIFENFVGL
ncbi:MAG: sulfite exporter TauE/SafE family protein [Oscillospiraceae bacterium]|nr:sulfite exporter TauE/SafE family protein [Oscillospiraceae bacterium]